ncbi:MAG: ABC transporter permease [Deltaproteobacteria bacterium]|nr:ABC transporter permease [Deltaproteobacteria bacterium]
MGLGDRVVLTASPVGAARPAAAAFRVCGLVRTGVDELDGAWTEIPLDEAQKLLGLGERVSQVAVLLGDLEQSDAAAVALQKELGAQGELEVLSWKTALRELYEAIVLDELGLYLMMAIVFVIVAIGIFNTVLMSVTERTRELGVMMAIGTSRWLLGRIVMAEALVLGLVSSAAGLAIGLVLHAWVARHGIDIMAIAGAEQYEVAGVAFAGRIYSRLTALGVVKWTLVVMAVVLGSAAYPALRASRLRPVEAMRHV